MTKLKIKRLGVLSVAKIYAVMMFALSLLISVPYGLILMFIGLSGASSAKGQNAMLLGGGGVIGGLLLMIGLPLFYAVFGFVAGAISAFVYNIFAGLVGGVEMEVETVQ